jgi:G3E family GTPase
MNSNRRNFPAPIPVTIIGGFLGAGKTTLLNHILTEDHGVKAAVLVNDFGAINIDAQLVVGVEGERVEMSNGCICCSIRGDLIDACCRLLKRESGLDHLLIEMSGVSDPEPVIETFYELDLLPFFSVNAVLAVVDAEKLPDLAGEVLTLAKSQIEYADIVVVNKIDLVDQAQLDEVTKRVHRVSPTARIIEVKHGRVPFELVFGDNFRTTGASVSVTRQMKGHPHSNSDHIFTSWNWKSTKALSLCKLRAALDRLPDSIYRCKGFVYIEELTRYRYIIQMVGKRLVIMQGGLWDGKEPISELVLIGSKEGINEKDLLQRFDACIGQGDESGSPMLRLARKIVPEWVAQNPGP